VTRRNYAAAVQDLRTGLVYALCCSTTTDGFDDQKEAMFKAMLRSFVVN
jgi:DNA-binding IclR family transcriptional regulator